MQSSRPAKAGLTALATLLLFVGLLTSVGQAHAAANGTLAINNTWTSAPGNFNNVSSFNQGDNIQYNVNVANNSGANMNVRLHYQAYLGTVNGFSTQIEDFISNPLNTPQGNLVV